jgi:hypothetical protein
MSDWSPSGTWTAPSISDRQPKLQPAWYELIQAFGRRTGISRSWYVHNLWESRSWKRRWMPSGSSCSREPTR